jgi:CYTH domain-containing protein/thymidylate kinase
MNDIKKIVLTGGPCAGKTTALVRIIEHFSSLGFKVFTIPEVPTIFTQAGMNYLTKNQAFFYEGEKATLEIQLALEDKFLRMAEQCQKPCIIVCDRGAMDISAYMAPDVWEQITRAVGTDTAQLRERYDAVLHLVSAADGAEQYYTTANNAQRYEKKDEEGLRIARLLDKKVMQAWTGHPHLRVINNHDDFDCKMNRVVKEISGVLGLPQPIVEERKYIVELTGEMPADSIASDITQTYLIGEQGTEIRLRKRGWGKKFVYVHTTKKKTSDHEELVTERQINLSLYEMMLSLADPDRLTIHKQRNSFVWKGQYFEVDTFLDELQGLMILETKGIAESEELQLPPFLRIVKDITGQEEYYNFMLARKKK